MNTKPLKLVVAALLLTVATSTARAITYKTLDDPGSIRTDAFGISGNNIVGMYANSFYHGFLYDGTTYTPIDNPAATNFTVASGIDGNNIVGDYSDSSGKDHGFLYNGSSFTTLDDPLGVNRVVAGVVEATSPLGISGNNIVGLYYDSSDVVHGFLYNGATWTPLDFPGSTYTDAFGISGNRIVGSYADAAGNKHGYLYDDSAYTTLDAPLGTKGTFASGIDGNNIVGSYTDASGLSHGFLYNGSAYTTLDDPSAGPVGTVGNYSGSNGTSASAISGNNIVGYYIDSSGFEHGFEATVPEPSSLMLIVLAFLAVVVGGRRLSTRNNAREPLHLRP
ncbi:MAG TPA: PEP-CTERM sorting domain-containing protein [Lacipirellulaceae bacterium]|nr:PEP-CTERM sorting domain-containing protein [Lacipirellulaceae bacterium]